MALPSIAPYSVPQAGDLPVNKVSWRPEPERAVLLIHDMEKHFVNAFSPGREPRDAVSEPEDGVGELFRRDDGEDHGPSG